MTDGTMGEPAPAALVTGAARRLGAAIARALHAAGFDVAIHYQRAEREATALVAELEAQRPGSAAAFAADLATEDAPAALVAAAARRFGGLDALVNNAAVFRPTPLAAASRPDWDAIMGVNLRAPFFLARAAAPLLAARAGCIVNLTDIYAGRPKADYSVYCAAKAGLVGLTRALARDLAPQVRVNAVAPGAILWPEGGADEARDAILARTPLGRRGEPDDVAQAVCYLVGARFVTGQVIAIDGGRSLNE